MIWEIAYGSKWDHKDKKVPSTNVDGTAEMRNGFAGVRHNIRFRTVRFPETQDFVNDGLDVTLHFGRKDTGFEQFSCPFTRDRTVCVLMNDQINLIAFHRIRDCAP